MLGAKGIFVLFLFGSTMAFPPMPEGDPTAAIEGLVTRILGASYVDKFIFKLIPDENGFDVFELIADLDQNKPVLSGNNGVALASAFNYYLKYFCNCSISWGRNGTGDQLRMPGILPLPRSKIRVVFPNRFRYYQNVCTVSYSMVWWNWARWEREIDWMAMNGLNFILSFTGQEYVWQKFYSSLGLTDAEIKEFFSGPAFLAWQRMGNIRGWGGPLDDGWIKKQADIQKQIVGRIRQFGMINILPGFAGHVPKGLQRVYPSANLTRNAGWGRFGANYSEDYLLEPTDPLFLTLGQKFYKMLMEEFGNDHFFNTDTYNEMNPSSSDLEFLKATNKAIYDAMAKVDSEAVFVMQGWLFHSRYWNNTKINAFLSGVPNNSMVILDLNSEQSPPIWSSTESYYGKPFIWCLLHNFGGLRGIYGNLSKIGTLPVASRKTPGNTMVGVGMTPEAIEHNPVVYDLMGEMSWRSEEVTDIMGWLDGYITRRYGSWTQESHDAWQLLLQGAYSFDWGRNIHSIATRAPGFNLSTDMNFIPAFLTDAWRMLLTAVNDGKLNASVGPLRYDIVDIGRQILMDLFADVYKIYSQTAQLYYKSNDTTLVSEMKLLGATLIDILTDIDTLLATDINFLLGTWLEDARQSAPDGASQDVLDLIEFNARNQITMWGPNENIEDYAGKEWAGSVGTYYVERWKIFIEDVTTSIHEKKPFNTTACNNKRFQFEQSWDYEKTSYPSTPQGDTIEVANMIMKKYLRSEAELESSYTMMVNKSVHGNYLYGQAISLWTNSTGQLVWFCDMNPSCAGFTTPGSGFRDSVFNGISSPGTTLYVKKNKARHIS